MDIVDASTERLVPPSMDAVVAFGTAAAVVATVGMALIVVIAVVAGVMRRWHR